MGMYWRSIGQLEHIFQNTNYFPKSLHILNFPRQNHNLIEYSSEIEFFPRNLKIKNAPTPFPKLDAFTRRLITLTSLFSVQLRYHPRRNFHSPINTSLFAITFRVGEKREFSRAKRGGLELITRQFTTWRRFRDPREIAFLPFSRSRVPSRLLLAHGIRIVPLSPRNSVQFPAEYFPPLFRYRRGRKRRKQRLLRRPRRDPAKVPRDNNAREGTRWEGHLVIVSYFAVFSWATMGLDIGWSVLAISAR